MRSHSPFQVFVFFMAVLTFSMPFTRYASVQATETKRMARLNTNCLMPGINTAPTEHVPRILFASQLLGKSPEYVTHYAQNPQATTRSNWEFVGCVVIGIGVGVVIGLILFVIFIDTLLII